MLHLNDLSSLKKDDVLKAVGLESHRPGMDMISSVALFGFGVLVGAGIGMLMAPRAGRELRSDLSDRIGQWRGRRGSDSGIDRASSGSPTSSMSGTTDASMQGSY